MWWTLKAYWSEFDEVHAHQAPGMKPLYGLVEFTGSRAWNLTGCSRTAATARGCFPDLLRPLRCSDDIERLWGSTMLARWPDRIVTEISPHAALSGTFGRALRFWHEVALTTWYLAEGPFTRSQTQRGWRGVMLSISKTWRRSAAPVDPTLFTELIEGEAKLGPKEPVDKDPVSPTFLAVHPHTQRPGFEILRDIVTRHRHTWLSATWTPTSSPDGTASFERQPAIMPRPSPPRGNRRHQSSSPALRWTPTNHWLGGDISAFYAAIGEKSAVHPRSGFA